MYLTHLHKHFYIFKIKSCARQKNNLQIIASNLLIKFAEKIKLQNNTVWIKYPKYIYIYIFFFA